LIYVYYYFLYWCYPNSKDWLLKSRKVLCITEVINNLFIFMPIAVSFKNVETTNWGLTDGKKPTEVDISRGFEKKSYLTTFLQNFTFLPNKLNEPENSHPHKNVKNWYALAERKYYIYFLQKVTEKYNWCLCISIYI